MLQKSMRRKTVFFALLTYCICSIVSLTIIQAKETTTCKVFFSPRGYCTDAVIKEINKAKSSIFVMAYSFTSAPIAKTLLDAKKRGVKVEVIIDHSRNTEKYTETRFFKNMGIPVYVDSKEAIQHNKVMIIDSETVITGSFNFTKAAEEKNAENLLVIKSKELAKVYLENWEKHRDHSVSYSQNAHVNTPITRSANNQGNNISDHEQQPTRFFLKSIFH